LTLTVHQSCIKSSSIPKQTEPSFHLSHVTKDSHRVCPKRFLCLWYVRCKPCTCLALTLTLSPNGLKRDSTRPMSLTSPSGASQTICEPRYIQCKPCNYLMSRLALSPNGPNRAPPDPRHLGLPSGASKLIYDPMIRLTQIVLLSCTDANTVSKQIETRFHKTHIN
jgi:hypothetical protein